ncbi:P cell-type agglutination protein map4-like [Arapaima gigas]
MEFTSALNDKTSQRYKDLEATIVFQLSSVYKAKYGSVFLTVVVLSFRKGSVVVDTELQFNTSASVTLPSMEDVKNTLIEATQSNNFTLNISTSSIVIKELNASAAITVATQSAVGPNATTALLETTRNFTAVSSSSTTAPALSSITATSVTTTATETVRLRFTMSKHFTAKLSDSSSMQFKAQAAEVSAVLDPIFTVSYGSQYKGSNVTQFSKGSVVTDVNLYFRGPWPLPTATAVVNTLKQALSDNNPLSIILDSIQINNAAGRNGVSAVLLAALTLLLVYHV